MPMVLPVDTLAPPCLFCEATAGRFQKGTVEQTQLIATMVSGTEFERGQIFVTPRAHRPTLPDLVPDELIEILVVAQRMAKALVKA